MGILWYGGKIYTLENEGDTVQAVLTKEGEIAATGNPEYLRETFHKEITNEHNLQGNTMIPGLVDSHMHLIGHGEKLLRLDFSKIKSSAEMLNMIKKRVREVPEGRWIIGEGWNEHQLEENKILHRTELDEAAPNHPVMLRRICRHALLANSKALQLANISKETIDPAGGVIVREGNNHPTGYLLDNAQDMILNIAPFPTLDEIQYALETSIKDCYKKGLVGGHTEDLSYYGSLENTLKAYENVVKKGLKFRSHLLVHHHVVDEFHLRKREHGPFIEFGAMKIFADGALGGRTALLSFPYKDDPSTSGVAIHPKEDLEELIKKARKFKMEVAVHAIGDLAFEWILELIEKHPPGDSQHDRLIHAQILREELIEKAKSLPIILDIQPRFVGSDFPWVIDRIGKEYLKTCYAWKTLIDSGIPCAGGSDAPIEPVDPILGIYAAVTRKSDYENSGKSYMPDQKLSVFEAVELYTKGSAYAVHKENKQGKILPGYAADFTIFDQNIFAIDTEELLDTNVVMTVVDGDIMYKRGQ
ncbi:amidohydrolase [Metabacillus niabensis]|uniref:amidohydrolase n=1 Tax=Metabacillus niabensis TaxID=324854 RepID=UPI001CFA3861|nr:amidohydrolase [Metabacillus niabensis]